MKFVTTVERIAGCPTPVADWVGTPFESGTIDLQTLLQHSGLDVALWALRVATPDPRRVAAICCIEFAEQALPAYENQRPDDPRLHALIDVARAFLHHDATLNEVKEAKRQAHGIAAYTAHRGLAVRAAAETVICAMIAAQMTHGMYCACIEKAKATSADMALEAAVYAAEAVSAAHQPQAIAGLAGVEAIHATHQTSTYTNVREAQASIVCGLLA